MGAGTYVSPLAQVIGDVRFGERCYVGHGAILRGDYGTIIIGSGTAVEEGVVIHAPPQGTCLIGEKVTLGHAAVLHGEFVGDLAVVGIGAVLGLRCRVGKRAILAEGTVVKSRQEIPPGVVAAGNPARVVRPVKPEDEEFWAWAKQLYIDLAAKYLALGMEPVTLEEAMEPGRGSAP
ncbi:MAG: gamma carbonic anhydrase family protein [Clostridia bacterium]|nr:gamma carbonic anhydrase family protein [Clostridia bacterium]MDH7572854.1 gamma carbonic anhydrase family protein [Clostridia bacterium]